MKNFLKRNRTVLVFTLAGIAAGFLYWHFIGCSSGSCPVTSEWHMSTAFGGIFGYLLGDIVKDAAGGGNSKNAK
jgi:hypothetical protein